MDTLVRTNTLRMSMESSLQVFSRHRRSHRAAITSYDDRQERAKHRRAFLKTYKLGSVSGSKRGRNTYSSCNILGENKAIMRMKAAAVRFIRFARDGLMGSSCKGRSAMGASSPVPRRHFVRGMFDGIPEADSSCEDIYPSGSRRILPNVDKNQKFRALERSEVKEILEPGYQIHPRYNVVSLYAEV